MRTLHTAQLTGDKFAGCWDVDSFKTRNSWKTCFALKYLRQPPAFGLLTLWAPCIAGSAAAVVTPRVRCCYSRVVIHRLRSVITAGLLTAQTPLFILLYSKAILSFKPRDAKLARHQLSPGVCLTSVTSRRFIEMSGRITLVLACGFPSTYTTRC